MDETQALSDDEQEVGRLLLDEEEVRCRLVLVSDHSDAPKELLLSSGENHIGRAERGWDQEVPYHQINSEKVSRRHAVIEPLSSEQKLFVRDQNSRCGTTIYLQDGWPGTKSKKKDRPAMVPPTGFVSFGPIKYKPCWGAPEAATQAYVDPEPETQAYKRASMGTTPPGSPPATPNSALPAPVPATPAALSGDTMLTSGGRVATVLERRSNDMLYVELDGNANSEGAAFERRNIRASEVTARAESETQVSDAGSFLRGTPEMATQAADATGFLPSPRGVDYGNDETQLDTPLASLPEEDETQLDEAPPGDETQLEVAPPPPSLTQLEPVAEDDGTDVEENDETQLEAPAADNDELRFEEEEDEAPADAETQLEAAAPPPEATQVEPEVALPAHASPMVLDNAAQIAAAAAADLASPSPRRRGSNPVQGPPSAPGKGAARELFSFEDDAAPAPAPVEEDEGPADDRTADGVFAESEGEEEAAALELRVGGGAVDGETGQTCRVVGKTKGWWTVQLPGSSKALSRRASSLTPAAPPAADEDPDAETQLEAAAAAADDDEEADANAETQLGGAPPPKPRGRPRKSPAASPVAEEAEEEDDANAETQLDAPPPPAAEDEDEEEEAAPSADNDEAEELRVGGGAIDAATGNACRVVGQSKGWWTVQFPGSDETLKRRANQLTAAVAPADEEEDAPMPPLSPEADEAPEKAPAPSPKPRGRPRKSPAASPAAEEAEPESPAPPAAEDFDALVARDAPIERTEKARGGRGRSASIEAATTVREYFSRGGKKPDLKYDLKNGFFRVRAAGAPAADLPDEEEEEEEEAAAPPPKPKPAKKASKPQARRPRRGSSPVSYAEPGLRDKMRQSKTGEAVVVPPRAAPSPEAAAPKPRGRPRKSPVASPAAAEDAPMPAASPPAETVAELRVGGGAVDAAAGNACRVVGQTKGWWTVQFPGSDETLKRRSNQLTATAAPPVEEEAEEAPAPAPKPRGRPRKSPVASPVAEEAPAPAPKKPAKKPAAAKKRAAPPAAEESAAPAPAPKKKRGAVGAADARDQVRTAGGRVATIIERRARGWLYVELDGDSNDEGGAHERKFLRATATTALDAAAAAPAPKKPSAKRGRAAADEAAAAPPKPPKGKKPAVAPAPAPAKKPKKAPAPKKRKADEEPAPPPKEPAAKAAKPKRGKAAEAAAPPKKKGKAEAHGDEVRLVFTNYEATKAEDQLIKALGWTLADARHATHVVTTKALKRTPKLLIGISVARHVVTNDWLSACLACNGRADEKPFLVKDKAKEKLWGFSLARSLAQNPRTKVLAGYAVALAPGARDEGVMMLPTDDELRAIVECAGGAWLPSLPRTGSPAWPRGLIVVGCADLLEGGDRAATRCLGALAKLDPGTLAGFVEPPALYGGVLSKKLDPQRSGLALPASCAHVVK